MSKIKEVLIELNLTEENLRDKEIIMFANDVLNRKLSGQWYQYWNGNGYCELNKNDGTMITTVLTDEDFMPEFPLNCDMEISKKCLNGCPFCYAKCTPNGKHADIKKFIEDKNSFLYTLHEGTELALNGNEPLHPELGLLLTFLKDRGVIANLTVRENTLLKHKKQIERWMKDGMLHGIGVSPSSYSDKMIEWCQKHPTAVIHSIAGITTSEQYQKLYDKGLKILILGYKDFGRGLLYRDIVGDNEISCNMHWLEYNVESFKYKFNVVSFDNLAIKQLDPKQWLSDEEWATFYRGDDGHHTLFIDLVNETFAVNSMQERQNHKNILKDIRDMLKEVQGG